MCVLEICISIVNRYLVNDESTYIGSKICKIDKSDSVMAKCSDCHAERPSSNPRYVPVFSLNKN